MKLTFNQYVFLKIRPRMLCKPVANGLFNLVPLEKPTTSIWQYALVNQDRKIYKMTFAFENELIATLFDASEIWYGSRKYSNALYGKKDLMKIEYDLEANIQAK